MIRTLGKVFEMFKVHKRFTISLLELHDILPNESGLVNKIEFSKILNEIIPKLIKSTAKLYSHFLARSLSTKGTKHNLNASSPKWCILIMRHTFSNSFIKSTHPRTLDMKLWDSVYKLWFQFKIVAIGFQSRMQNGREVLIG